MTAAAVAPVPRQAAGGVTAAQRRAAFASIYNQSHGMGDRARTLLPEAYRPIPLGEALEILSNDSSHHGDAHRARALANLAGNGIHHVQHHRELLNDFYRKHRQAGSESGSRALHELVPPDTPKLEARDRVHLMLSVPDQTTMRKRQLDVWYQARAQVTKTKMTLELNEGLDELARMVDPRSWSLCSDLFAHSYQVAEGNGWGPGAPPPIRSSPPGYSFDSLFYESFELSFNAIVSNLFDNILHCNFQVRRDAACNVQSILLEYQIKRAIRSQDLWLERQGGIDVDFGMLSAEPCGDGWLRVTATKNVRFTPLDSGHPNFDLPRMFVDVQNAMVPSLMAYWAEDWVEKSVGCKALPAALTPLPGPSGEGEYDG